MANEYWERYFFWQNADNIQMNICIVSICYRDLFVSLDVQMELSDYLILNLGDASGLTDYLCFYLLLIL